MGALTGTATLIASSSANYNGRVRPPMMPKMVRPLSRHAFMATTQHTARSKLVGRFWPDPIGAVAIMGK
jgi:hypothetical protein